MSVPGKARSIWWWALGYFAAYVPYSALTKALSSPRPGKEPLSGVELLAGSTVASLLTAGAFLVLSGWWRDAPAIRLGRIRLPYPTLWPALSGLCSAAIIATTTLSYTFSGASIVLMMLLMRGGVLLLAPLVDLASRRKVRPTSWIALALTLGGVLVATVRSTPLWLTAAAVLDVGVYLAAYFIRLRLMTHSGKRSDPSESRTFFVEEQLVSSPAIVGALALVAWLGDGATAEALRAGYATLLWAPETWAVIAVGVASQGTGLFGALVLLDARENSFCVPVNRGSSILAGIVATTLLAFLSGGDGTAALNGRELGGALFVIGAMAVLAIKPRAPAPTVSAAAG